MRVSRTLPEKIAPMLAKRAAPFDSDRHLFEIKWDGIRCIAFIGSSTVRLQSRHFQNLTPFFPEIACLSRLPPGTILDGELVVLRHGRPSLSAIQQRQAILDPWRIEVLVQSLPATYVVFDLLYLHGQSMLSVPLVERKRHLLEIVKESANPKLICPDYVPEAGVRYFEQVKRQGFEGVMAKRLDSSYRKGKRSGLWLKVKAPGYGRD